VGAAAVVAAGALGSAVLLVRAGDPDAVLPFTTTVRAVAPFGDFREARVAAGGRCLRVLVASDARQRAQGLRGVRSLAPYDGMLFVFPADTAARFTMAGTPMPLDITWFAGDGAPIDGTRMAPCPGGTDAACPEYASRDEYRYALERPAGSGAGPGGLGACA
jgi:uncharacterized membrane protein (UPF0127 family)